LKIVTLILLRFIRPTPTLGAVGESIPQRAQGRHSAQHCGDQAVARHDRSEDFHHFTVSGGQDAHRADLQ
jgi:hypothetical protein